MKPAGNNDVNKDLRLKAKAKAKATGVENRGKISHFLTSSVKIRGRVGKISESILLGSNL